MPVNCVTGNFALSAFAAVRASVAAAAAAAAAAVGGSVQSQWVSLTLGSF